MLHGLPSHQTDEMPIWGLARSSTVRPHAWSIDWAAPLSADCVMKALIRLSGLRGCATPVGEEPLVGARGGAQLDFSVRHCCFFDRGEVGRGESDGGCCGSEQRSGKARTMDVSSSLERRQETWNTRDDEPVQHAQTHSLWGE